jgi:TonB family protein
MFTLLSDESVSSTPKKNALYLSLITHVCACMAAAGFSLTGVPPVRFKLTTVYAGSPEPVRAPQPILYKTVGTSSAARPDVAIDVAKAVPHQEEISHVQPDDNGERADYAPTAIRSDLLALLGADVRHDADPGPAPANIRNISLLTPLAERLVPEPPEPPPGKPDVQPPIAIGGRLEPAVLLEQTKPAYPTLAKTARVEGVVVLEGTINVRGRVENIRVVSGHPMLLDAAVKALEKWKYAPAKLNGQIIPCPLRVQVLFKIEYPNE